MKDALIVSLLSVLPQRLLSRTQGALARTGLSRHLIGWFVRHYGIDTSEMVRPPADYPTLQDFFVRELKAGLRPVDRSEGALVSPADSRASAFGRLTDQGSLPAEAGIRLDIAPLLGGEGRYAGGDYAVLYLSPKDYHRVHHPISGRVSRFLYLPGRLWPVFPHAVRRVPQLFAVNERLVLFVDTPSSGRVAVVMVGAYGVGRMSCSHAQVLTNSGSGGQQRELDAGVQAGEELGRFNLGSTVVLVFEPGRVRWELERDQAVKVGQRIGKLL